MSADFRLRQLTTGPFNQNSLILSSSSGCAAVVVDPGAPVVDILHALSLEGLQCREIWLTHSHFDNCGAAAELKRRTGAIIRGHRAGERFRRSLKDMAAEWELDSSAIENCPEPDEYFVERQQLRIASCELEVIFTPGHSPDHVSFYAPKERLLSASIWQEHLMIPSLLTGQKTSWKALPAKLPRYSLLEFQIVPGRESLLKAPWSRRWRSFAAYRL